ncbi:hypothetical protein PENTCL1PPCAC_19544, partial [Pristionchus entomophagus]
RDGLLRQRLQQFQFQFESLPVCHSHRRRRLPPHVHPSVLVDDQEMQYGRSSCWSPRRLSEATVHGPQSNTARHADAELEPGVEAETTIRRA